MRRTLALIMLMPVLMATMPLQSRSQEEVRNVIGLYLGLLVGMKDSTCDEVVRRFDETEGDESSSFIKYDACLKDERVKDKEDCIPYTTVAQYWWAYRKAAKKTIEKACQSSSA